MQAFALARHECKYYQFVPFTSLEHGLDASRINVFSGLHSDPEVNQETRVHVYHGNVPGWRAIAPYYTREVKAELLRMYLSTPKPEDCPYDLAIHVRRGDVFEGFNDGWDRWIPDEVYDNVITDWLAHSPNAKIGLYSEGNPTDFVAIIKFRPQVHLVLNGEAETAFHHFVTAPALAVGPSSFSMVPGHMSKNNVFFLARDGDWRIPAMEHYGVTMVPLLGNRPQWPANFRWNGTTP